MGSVMLPAAISTASGNKEFQAGDIVDGRYRIVRKLADGGMGAVFLAEHMLIKRRLAIKQLHAELAGDETMVHHFLNEGSASGTLGHPHIVESTDMGFTRNNVPYIVFEYLEGRLLAEEIQRLGRLPVRRALLIARQIASALEAAHHAQIAHLDLKSDNIFLVQRGDALDHSKLLDFGISKFCASEVEDTNPGVLMGTPEFMAPEQIIMPDRVDCRADIYALGVLLYEMLAGKCPFSSDDPRAVMNQILNDSPPPISRPLPLALESLVFDGLLVKSREHRLQSMSEILILLDDLIAAIRPGVPDATDTFAEPDAKLASGTIPPGWPIESWFDAVPEPTPAFADGSVDIELDDIATTQICKPLQLVPLDVAADLEPYCELVVS